MTGRGMLFTLSQIRNPDMRRQAEEKMQQWPRKKGSTPLMPKLSEPEERLAFYLRAEGLGHFEREYVFWAERKFRSDFAYVDERVLIEIDGGLHNNGRHTRAKGFEKDCIKINEAQLLGWIVLRFSPAMVSSGHAVHIIKRALERAATTNGRKEGAGNVREEKGPVRRTGRGSGGGASQDAAQAGIAGAAHVARR